MKRAVVAAATILAFTTSAPAQSYQVGMVTGIVELAGGRAEDVGKEISVQMLSGYDRRQTTAYVRQEKGPDGTYVYGDEFTLYSVYPANYDLLITVQGYRIHREPNVPIRATNTRFPIDPPKPPIVVPRIPDPGGQPGHSALSVRNIHIRLVRFEKQLAPAHSDSWPVPTGTVGSGRSPVGGATAEILVRDAKTGELREAAAERTENDGHFAVKLDSILLAGVTEYVFIVRLKGFQPYVRVIYPGDTFPSKIELTPEHPVRLGVISETQEAAYRFVYSPYLLESIPLPGIRSFDYLALLSPGIVPAPTAWRRAGPGIAPGVGPPGQFIVNGLRGRQNNFVIDGADDNDEELGIRRQGFVALVPQPASSIQEFQVVAAVPDATYGRDIGGQVNALTRSGAAQLHGDVAAYFSDNHFNARDFFTQNLAAGSTGPPLLSGGAPATVDGVPVRTRNPAYGNYPFRRTQAEANISGPILKPSSFFYFSFASIVTTASEEHHFAVPTVAQRGVKDTGGTGFSQFSLIGSVLGFTPASLPGNGIFSLFPFPNNPSGPFGANTYTTNLRANQHAYPFTVKTDHRAGPLALAFRYSRAWESSFLPTVDDALYSTIYSKIRSQSFAGYLDIAPPGNFSSSFRFSFGNSSIGLGGAGVQSPLGSALFPGNPLLLNAPLLLDASRPGAAPNSYVSGRSAAGSQLLTAMGIDGGADSEAVTGPLGQVRIAGFSPIGVDVFRFPQDRDDRTWQIGNISTIARGLHTFRFGFDSRFTQLRSTQDRNSRPYAEFHGLQGGTFQFGSPSLYTSATSMAAMGATTGMYQTLESAAPPSLRLSSTQIDAFATADLALSRRIRLQAGLRYGWSPLPSDADQVILRNFDFQALSAQVQQGESACSPACPGLLNNVLAAFPGDFRSVFGAHASTWDPRAGLVWDVTGKGTTIVRAGAGLYTSSFPALIVTESRSGFPTALPLNLANFPTYLGLSPFDLKTAAARSPYLFNLANPAVRAQESAFSSVWQAGSLNHVTPPTFSGKPDPIALLAQRLAEAYPVLAPLQPQFGLRHPWALQNVFSVEHRFGSDNVLRVSYVGTQGRHLLRATTLDHPPRTFLAFGGAVLPYINAQFNVTAPFPIFFGDLFPNLVARSPLGPPAVNGIGLMRTVLATDGASSYDSLQVDFRHRYSRRFLLGSAFTWSHAIDNASDIFDDQTGFSYPQDSFAGSERGSSDFDTRLRWVTHFVYDSPVTAGNRFLRAWRLAAVYALQSGHPYNITSSIDVNGDGLLTDRLNLPAGIVPATGGDPRVRVTIAPGLAPAGLLAPRMGAFNAGDGIVGRNAFVSWGASNLDAAVEREFRIGESLRVTGRVEAFNVLNHTQFAAPASVLEAPSFGQAVSTQYPARRLRFSLRVQF